uniref:HTH CENPB-type domain-containing protein n=1 Tax=Eptatretus burgeri TaxID=7764 RepID=A0A8C4QGB8_EPTBU
MTSKIHFGNREAGRRFGMDESVIRRWRTSKATIEKMPRKKALRGKSAKWPQLTEHLVAWVLEKRAKGSAISTLALRMKVKSLAEEDDIGDFIASPSWAYTFMARHQLSARCRTLISQHIPDNMPNEKTSFLKCFISNNMNGTEDDIWKEETVNDSDSNVDLLSLDSDKELRAIFDEESIDEDFLRFS